MEKFVFFGDSNTYGSGLGGKRDTDWNNGPHPLGWANMLCIMRNATGRNLSKPGSSNLQILWTIINTEIEPDETIIVQWSYWNRDCVLDNNIVQIRPDVPTARLYYKTHTDIDMQRRNWMNINHGYLWLTQKLNKFLMLGNKRVYNVDNLEYDIDIAKLTDTLIPYYFSDYWYDLAEDGVHYGTKSNTKWAAFVNSLLDSELKG